MSKIVITLCAVFAIFTTACAQNNSKSDNMKKKTLVTYFSATGTTENAAKKIASVTGADIMPIQPVQKYTAADLDWTNRQSRSSLEMNNLNSRPEIEAPSKNISEYDVVFIGYPIWWNLAPTVVNTFIESNDLTGKTVIPFATSGGDGIGNSASKLKSQYPNLNWKEGKLLNGTSEKAIEQWIESLNL